MNGTLSILKFAASIVVTGAAVAALFGVALGSAAAASPLETARAGEYPLSVVYFTTSPSRPKAGSSFLAGLAVLNEETGAPVQSGSLSCRAKIAKRSVRVRVNDFGDGVGACMWQIAPKTDGKRFYATVTLNSDEGYVVQRFTKLIRR